MITNFKYLNKACDWVATEIVLTSSLYDRVQVIEKFIRVAQVIYKMYIFPILESVLI